jgi:hypothetical protein
MSISGPLEDVLKSFQPITLCEMDSVELMDRTDTKYVFHIKYLTELLSTTNKQYKILEINNQRSFSYKTTYYDTLDYTLFNNHILGRINRHKIRHRTYESTGVSYLEIKCKSNKNRTIKWRIKNEMNGHFDPNAVQFLHGYTKMDAHKLLPMVTNHFTRITLVSILEKTRITLDFNISFQNNQLQVKDLPCIAIAEVKQENSSNSCFFSQQLRNKQIRPASFSKYCIGSALLYDIPKKNALKPNFLQIKRIENEDDTRYTLGR